jgi:virulence-associated protein VagC
MTTLAISPEGKLTLPQEVLQLNTWKNIDRLELLRLGDMLVLRPAHYQKSDDISDLGGFFKGNTTQLNTDELCQPVDLASEDM